MSQLKWIDPKSGIKILIGAPKLESLICDAHSKVEIKNWNAERFKVRVNVGTISLSGQLAYLDLKVNVAKVNIEALNLETADVVMKN